MTTSLSMCVMTVWASTQAPKSRRKIIILDPGHGGIDPGAMETLFNRFSHGKTHTAAGDRPRYGIGLALVREIAHAHRGHITVAQTPGGGATFTLTIPAAPDNSW